MWFAVALVGCTTATERAVERELAAIERRLAAPAPSAGPAAEATSDETPENVRFDGTLGPYLAYAFAHSPDVRAAYEAYRAAAEEPKIARRLPEPTLSFAGFVRAVETRVGPQRANLGVAQWFPWPSRLIQAGHAAALRAQAAGRAFEAAALEVARRVTHAYAELWRIDRNIEVETERATLFEGLADAVRIRTQTGRARIADVARIETRVLRARDRIAALEAARRSASAELRRAVGAPVDVELPVVAASPPVGAPAVSDGDLVTDAESHPRIAAMASMSEAERRAAKARRGERFPSFGIGLNWIITGASSMDPPPSDSGKDAVVATGMLRLPLWQRSYGAAERKARALARMYDARRRALVLDARAQVEAALSRLDDALRRVEFYERTLVRQAEAALGSMRAAYAAEKAALADVLDAEEDLVELRRAAVDARADALRAYADLEALVGHPVPRKDMTP